MPTFKNSRHNAGRSTVLPNQLSLFYCFQPSKTMKFAMRPRKVVSRRCSMLLGLAAALLTMTMSRRFHCEAAHVDNNNIIVSDEDMHTNSNSIQHYFVFGLRFSGVRYVEQMLHQALLSNFVSISDLCDSMHEAPATTTTTLSNATTTTAQTITAAAAAEWHPWKYEPFSKKELTKQLSSQRCISSHHGDIDATMKKTLFIMVVKDPYSWLSSVVRQKYKKAAEGNKLLRIHAKTVVNSPYQELRHLLEQRPPLEIVQQQQHQSDGTGDTQTLSGSLGKKRYRTLMSKRSFTLNKHFSTLQKLDHFAVVRYVSYTIGNIFVLCSVVVP
jgi:hypothetical protein